MDISTGIDDDLDTYNEYVTSADVSQRFIQSKSRHFDSRASSANYTKYKAKFSNTANDYVEGGSVITFGSSKKIRKNINSIENNINKLHIKSQSNWSKLDLKQKYLSNGSNFNTTYKRETHTLFDYIKVKDLNKANSKPHYEKVISGYPYENVSKEHKFQSDSLTKLCPGAFGSKSSADVAIKIMNIQNDNAKDLNKITSMLNVDQNLIYARK